MAEKKKKTVLRHRNYATMIYLDSAPENWFQILEDSHVPCFVSPYHCCDTNPNGEPKKPHYHVMVMFDNVKTKEQAIEFFNSIGGVGCEVLESPRGMARYLCHLDNPEKAQYSISEVRSLAGADYFTVINTMADRQRTLREIQFFCKDNCIYSFAILLDYCAMHRPEWYDCLINHSAWLMKEYIKSLNYTDTILIQNGGIEKCKLLLEK